MARKSSKPSGTRPSRTRPRSTATSGTKTRRRRTTTSRSSLPSLEKLAAILKYQGTQWPEYLGRHTVGHYTLYLFEGIATVRVLLKKTWTPTQKLAWLRAAWPEIELMSRGTMCTPTLYLWRP